MSLPREAAPSKLFSSQMAIFWLIPVTSSRTSSPVDLICAVRDVTAAVIWLWSSRLSWLWGGSWVGDAGGVSCAGSGPVYWFSGARLGKC
ncbi:uncharacterized protein ASPGLDRAFT_737601 [Aspergillus glaucus CBS 516.65]|uniref:Uncharacterized protein n=1 Tax=Aspergillus glaucus CBS 516.65 TaxID=1160497 RepID=A0A1L9VXU9_ASPGL|nr:hypothetical protein ASPGLDRAFT_737601 [Aspergillus glaucus CBS 516.65]OJJ88740.1 hypothetical protein ASPGLDRAFT_737601 [Aspergillus glaucus CBS 516.65]